MERKKGREGVTRRESERGNNVTAARGVDVLIIVKL